MSTSGTPLTILQGTSTAIVADGIAIDGVPTDVTGWEVRAVIRRYPGSRAVLAEWVSGVPEAWQGQAITDGPKVTLEITPALAALWTWRTGVIQARVVEPGVNGRTARVIDTDVRLSPDIVPTT